MGFGAAVSSGFNKYATFSGRAARSEYWWWFLFLILAGIGVDLACGIIFATTRSFIVPGVLLILFYLGVLLPNITLSVRRLHDLNRSGWWLGAIVFISLILLFLAVPVAIRAYENHANGLAPMDGIPSGTFIVIRILDLVQFIFGIVLFVWFCMRGTRGSNRFGADPLRDF